MNRKIKEALERGNLVAYGDLFASYSVKRQQEILKLARYLKTVTELKNLNIIK